MEKEENRKEDNNKPNEKVKEETKEVVKVEEKDLLNEVHEKYTQAAVTYEGHVYAIFNYKNEGLDSWDECKKFCEDMGGYLAVINSEAENDFVYKYVRDSSLRVAFFGYTDRKKEGKWKWVHGESSYTNWAKGQPNNGKNNKNKEQEDYAEFYKESADGTWNDAPFGSNTYRFICEWE